MKKLISFSVFLLLLLMLALGQRVQAQRIRAAERVEPAMRVWIPGHWKWNVRWKRYIWVPGHTLRKPAPVRVVRVRRVR
ncbi:MAG: hypothetical protein ACK5V5_07415 [Cyclobacteriaceae bacterium]|nr:hypothetical protein [Flammeovirgaceae bacterium]